MCVEMHAADDVTEAQKWRLCKILSVVFIISEYEMKDFAQVHCIPHSFTTKDSSF